MGKLERERETERETDRQTEGKKEGELSSLHIVLVLVQHAGVCRYSLQKYYNNI